MAEIVALRENFENGADGDVVTSTDTIFTTISGTGPAATFADNPYEGTLGIRVVGAGVSKTYRTDFTSQSGAWFGFAVRIDQLPDVVCSVVQGYQATALGFALRISTLGELQLRDGSTTRFTSLALTVNEWYWVSVKFIPGSATGARLKVYNRAAVNVYDSADGAATATTATAMDNLRIGYLAGTGAVTYTFDKLRADTTTEIAAVADSGTSVTATIAVSNETPDADTVVSLTASQTGGVGPFTYGWSQVSGSSVSLSGSGSTRTFTAPALIDGGTLTFQCIVTPSSGSPDTDTAEVGVKPHNFWTKHGGVLVPRRINTQDGGNLVP